MKNLLTFSQFIGEAEVNENKKHNGREVYPNWIDPSRDFGSPVKSIRELKVGAEYILWEPGMDTWQAEYVYQGKKSNGYTFTPSSPHGYGGPEGEPFEFSPEELEGYMKNGDIIKQN